MIAYSNDAAFFYTIRRLRPDEVVVLKSSGCWNGKVMACLISMWTTVTLLGALLWYAQLPKGTRTLWWCY